MNTYDQAHKALSPLLELSDLSAGDLQDVIEYLVAAGLLLPDAPIDVSTVSATTIIADELRAHEAGNRPGTVAKRTVLINRRLADAGYLIIRRSGDTTAAGIIAAALAGRTILMPDGEHHVAEVAAAALHEAGLLVGPGRLAEEADALVADVVGPRRLAEEADALFAAGVVKPEQAWDADARAAKLAVALQVTQEYLGSDVLPPLEGWSWWDALSEYHDGPFVPADMHEAFRQAGVDPSRDDDIVTFLRAETDRRLKARLLREADKEADSSSRDSVQEILDEALRQAPDDSPFILRGPPGAEPELVARATSAPAGSTRHSWIFSTQLRESLEHNQSLVSVLAAALEDLDEALARPAPPAPAPGRYEDLVLLLQDVRTVLRMSVTELRVLTDTYGAHSPEVTAYGSEMTAAQNRLRRMLLDEGMPV